MSFYNACITGNIKRVNEFLAYGYDPTAGNNSAMRLACNWNRVDVVKALLRDGRADPAALDSAALRSACKNGYTDIVKLLLQDGRADPTADWNYSIIQAILMGFSDIVALLLEDGRVQIKDPPDSILKYTTPEIKEMLIRYKYRVDGKEYCRLKEQIKN